jgi:hypothetical protein
MRHGLRVRHAGLPVVVFTDAESKESRCINGLRVETCVPNPFGSGTLITFASGDSVTVTDDFDTVVDTLIGDTADG